MLALDALKVVLFPFIETDDSVALAEVLDETPADAALLEIEPVDDVPLVEIEELVVVPFTETDVSDDPLDTWVFEILPIVVLPVEVVLEEDVPLDDMVLVVLFMVLFVVESIAMAEKLSKNDNTINEKITSVQNVKCLCIIS